jgi:hypothetical protein
MAARRGLSVSGRAGVLALLAGGLAAATPFANGVVGALAALLAGLLLIGVALWPRARVVPAARRPRQPRAKPSGGKRSAGQQPEVLPRATQQPAASQAPGAKQPGTKQPGTKQPAGKPQPAPRRRKPAGNAGGRKTVRR